jgi:hypothetical protein
VPTDLQTGTSSKPSGTSMLATLAGQETEQEQATRDFDRTRDAAPSANGPGSSERYSRQGLFPCHERRSGGGAGQVCDRKRVRRSRDAARPCGPRSRDDREAACAQRLQTLAERQRSQGRLAML